VTEQWNKEQETKLLRRRVSDFEGQEAALRTEIRSYQILVRNVLKAAEGLSYRLDAGRYERASGEAFCVLCLLEYRKHPEVPDHTMFHLLCDGSIVKL
jgi:hypothetical protein